MDVIQLKPRCRTDRGDGHLNSIAFSRGLTLIELLASIAIVAILVAVGVPSYSQFQASQRITSQINILSAGLALTRSAAIKRNQHVVLCKSPDGDHCQRTGATWQEGWLVFVDTDHDRKRGQNEHILYVNGPFAQGLVLKYAAFGSKHYVTYRPSGFTRTNGTFTLCDPRYPDSAKALILMKTGRVRASSTKSDGSPLDCGK
jgi:type IV fimbrial biogenesis protein FimT